MEIGLKLKEARELKGLSLDDLQETTKIQKRYLKAIEEGNLSILPGKFYARAFIKEYATAVGLNAEDLLHEYEAEIPKVEEEVTTQYTRIKQSKGDGSSVNSSALFSLVPTLTVIFLIVGIMFAAWWFYQKTSTTNNADPIDKNNENEIVRNQPEEVPDAVVDDTDADEKKAEEKAEAAAKKEAEAVEKDKEAAEAKAVEAEKAEKLAQAKKAEQEKAEKVEKKEPKKEQPAKKEPKKEPKKKKEEKLDTTVAILGTGSSPQSTIDVNNLTEDVKVTLESTGNTWLEVKNGAGKSLYSNTFSTENSPEEIDITNEERLYFVIGNAPDLKIKINGKELEYPIDPSQKVFQKIWLNLNKAAQ